MGEQSRYCLFWSPRKTNNSIMEHKDEYSYVSGYKAKSIKRQITQLMKLFPSLNGANQDLVKKITKNSGQLPEKAEGWFAVPDWRTIAETYEEAVHIIADLFKKKRKTRFHSYEEFFEPRFLRERAEKIQVMDTLKSEQRADILLFPAQLGLQYAGMKPKYSELPDDEFGFGFFELGIILMTHPKRMAAYYDIHVHAMGDDFSPEPNQYDGCIGFRYDGGGLNICHSKHKFEANHQNSYATGIKIK